MKKFLSLILALIFCITALAACSTGDKNNESNSEVSEVSEVSEDSSSFAVDFGDKDYILQYDGETLIGILFNPEATDGIRVEIPATCENGKTLKQISFSSAFSLYNLLPIYTEEALADIVAQIEANSESKRDVEIFKAFFLNIDINDVNLSKVKVEEYKETYPISNYAVIYVLEPSISTQEYLRLEEMLTDYTNVDFAYNERCAEELLAKIPDKDTATKEKYQKLFELYLNNLKFAAFDKVVELNFAAVSETVVLDMPLDLYTNVEKITGDLSNYFGEEGEFDIHLIQGIVSDSYSEFESRFYEALVESYENELVKLHDARWNDLRNYIPDIDFEGKDYVFVDYMIGEDFALKYLLINPEAKDSLTLDFSFEAETADNVVVTKAGYKLLPFLTVDAYNTIVNQMKDNGAPQDTIDIFESAYTKFDVNDSSVPQEEIEMMLKYYQFVEHFPAYILTPYVTNIDYDEIEGIVLQYTDLDTAYFEDLANEMLAKIPDSEEYKREYSDILSACIRNMKLCDFDKVTQLTFEKNVEVLSIDAFVHALINLESISGDMTNTGYSADVIERIKNIVEDDFKYNNHFYRVLIKAYDEGKITVND